MQANHHDKKSVAPDKDPFLPGLTNSFVENCQKMIQIKSFKSKPLQDQCSPSGFEANTGSQSGLPGTETNDPWCWKSVTPRQSVNVQVVHYLASSSRSRAVLYSKSDPCPGQPLWLHLSALMSPKASIFHSRYLWATFDIKCLSLIKLILPPAFEMRNLQICSFHEYHGRWPFCIKDARLCSVHNNGL